jgi:redox-sensitive bicupin YhaK (pirin superfamily)
MTRRFRVPATAIFLSFIMAMMGSVSQDAMAGIVALSQSTGASIFQEDGPAKIRSAANFAPHPHRNVSARYWIRGIVLLLIILLMLWLIYRTFTGWKPMIS